MEMVYVPEGKSQIGDDDRWFNDEHPEQEIYLDAFWIDKYEVTNRKYSACVKEGQCSTPIELTSSTREEYYGAEEFNDFPVVNVTWYQAREYCQWVGGSLPTEAQWEKAARGSDGQSYPWGEEEPTCEIANFDGCIGDTNSVEYYPKGASPYGVMGMAGNVMEWIADWYIVDFYSVMPTENSTGPTNGELRVIRGGAWQNGDNILVSSKRFRAYPRASWNYLGFRCVYPVIEE